MATADFTLRQDDTASPLTDTLEDATGAAVSIQGATVKLTMVPVTGGTAVLNAVAATNAQVGDGSNGTKGHVSYAWQAADTHTPGYFLASWTVTFVDNTIQTFPNDGYILIHITPAAPVSAGHLYVQVAELKETLGADTGYLERDIGIAIEAACRAIDGYKDARYYQTTETRYFTAASALQSSIVVGELATLTSLTLDTDDDGTYETTWVKDTDFYLSPKNAALDGLPYREVVLLDRAGRSFPTTQLGIKVAGSFGWPTTPTLVKQAAILLANRLLTRTRSAPLGILVAAAAEAVSMARLGHIDPDVAFLLDQVPGARSEMRAIQLS